MFILFFFLFGPHIFTCKCSIQKVIGLVQSLCFLLRCWCWALTAVPLGYPIVVLYHGYPAALSLQDQSLQVLMQIIDEPTLYSLILSDFGDTRSHGHQQRPRLHQRHKLRHGNRQQSRHRHYQHPVWQSSHTLSLPLTSCLFR